MRWSVIWYNMLYYIVLGGGYQLNNQYDIFNILKHIKDYRAYFNIYYRLNITPKKNEILRYTHRMIIIFIIQHVTIYI